NSVRSIESTAGTCAAPRLPTESVRRQYCQPDISIEENAHAGEREFPLLSDVSFSADDRKWPARGPIRSQSKTGSHIPASPGHSEDVEFPRSTRSRSPFKLSLQWQLRQSWKCIFALM